MRLLAHPGTYLMLLALLVACTSAATSRSPAASPTAVATTAATAAAGTASSPTIAGTPTQEQLPPAVAARIFCTYDEAWALVTAFLDAYNRGDQQALAPFFNIRKFQWYGVRNPGKPAFTARTVDAALAYFARRHSLGERLTLRELHFGGGADPTKASPRDRVDFWFYLDSTVAGQTTRMVGKGLLDCEWRQFLGWGMGPAPETASPTPPRTP